MVDLFEKYKNAKIKFKRKWWLTKCSLKMAENYIVLLSYKMTKYRRDQQKSEWYNDNLIIIAANHKFCGDEVAKECKRRNIAHSYVDFYKITVDPVTECMVEKPRYKIHIKETGPKVQDLVDWAVLKFNAEEKLITDEGIRKWNVWIQVKNEEE